MQRIQKSNLSKSIINFLDNLYEIQIYKKKKLINKIAILINWTRELDFYEKIIEKFDTNQISLIVNDIKTNEIEKKK